MEIVESKEVLKLMAGYPPEVQTRLNQLRTLIFKTASESELIQRLEETANWGEPAYITNIGSTLRMDWKEKNPDQYALYFQCTSQLVPTFRFVFHDQLTFEGNRAITLKLKDEVPDETLRKCIKAALTYHKIKKINNLGL